MLKPIATNNIKELNAVQLVETLNNSLLAAASLTVPAVSTRKRKVIKPWNDEIKFALKNSKRIDQQWKSTGKSINHPLNIERKKAAKQLRSAQRRERARRTSRYYSRLLDCKDSDSKQFYAIIAKQRNHKSTKAGNIVVDGTLITDDDELMYHWRKHFSSLALPSSNDEFDDEYKTQFKLNVENIEKCIHEKGLHIKITEYEVINAIQQLKNNKAADSVGVTAEHIKKAIYVVSPILTFIINKIFDDGVVPVQFKSGILTPVHKKGKPTSDPGNFRGITVTSLVGKVFERILLNHQDAAFKSHQSDLQFGFTSGCTPTMAALMVTEAIADSKDKCLPLFIASLDACKAFDVVDQLSLLNKFHNIGMRGSLWKIKKDSYQNLTSRIRLDDQLTDEFSVLQGVRQGGVTSTNDYKVYCNDLLKRAECLNIGLRLDNVYMGTPTCADDICLLSHSEYEIQCLLNLCKHYADTERYKIHPQKSVLSCYNIDKEWLAFLKENGNIRLGDESLQIVEKFTHLGIDRYTCHDASTKLIQDRIHLGRKTSYAMMGAGLYGVNGLPPLVSVNLYQTFVIPRMISGLETVTLKKSDMVKLEIYHKTTLKRLQGLPERTANEAVYLLSGVQPIEAILDMRYLSLFGAICRQQYSTIWNLAFLQVSTKDRKSKSWFINIQNLLYKYNLPDAVNLLDDPPQKQKWKDTVKKEVFSHWDLALKETASRKSSLQHIYWSDQNKPKAHRLWLITSDKLNMSRKAVIKAKVLLHVYGIRKRVEYKSNNTQCPLCATGETEDEKHFISRCMDSDAITIRQNFKQMFLDVGYLDYPFKNIISNDDESFTQLVLDFQGCMQEDSIKLNYSQCEELEMMTIKYIFKLHCNRAKKLAYRI